MTDTKLLRDCRDIVKYRSGHHKDCTLPARCNCGYDELLAKLDAALAASGGAEAVAWPEWMRDREKLNDLRQHLVDTGWREGADGEPVPFDQGACMAAEVVEFLMRLLDASHPAEPSAAIPMLLFCPNCGHQHVDAPEPASGWTNPPHKSHLCHKCKTVWRPAQVATNGVAEIGATGKADTWVPSMGAAEPSVPQGFDEGALWSLIRAVLTQGHAQQEDYRAGKYNKDGGYEAFSARVDLAARERVPAFLALLSAAPPPDAPDLGSSRSVASSGVGPECPTAVAEPKDAVNRKSGDPVRDQIEGALRNLDQFGEHCIIRGSTLHGLLQRLAGQA